MSTPDSDPRGQPPEPPPLPARPQRSTARKVIRGILIAALVLLVGFGLLILSICGGFRIGG